jgi:precorrin-4/cobalt-precorrin-4 C11-methyltransferase
MGKVHFIGAGPGDPELVTVKGKRLIESAGAVLYAGSLVPGELVSGARPDAEVRDSSSMGLEETHAFIMEHVRAGRDVARVHTGDPSLYGAMLEQMRLLDAEGVEYEVVPGVTAAFAAAAEARAVFTVPERCQTLVLTRLPGRTPVPEAERLRELAKTGAALAVYLSGGKAADLAEELRAAGLPENAPILCARRVGWPEQRLVWTDVAGLEHAARDMDRQTVFLVLPDAKGGQRSKLYDPDFAHGFRDKS